MNNGRWSMGFCPACERNNMFDLEHGIASWRQQMLAAGIRTPVPLEELEIHLREEVDQQIRAGASAQRAFDTAVQRLGPAHALRTEFDRTPGASGFLQPRYLAAFCFLAAPLLALLNLLVLQPDGLRYADRLWGLATMGVAVLYVTSLPFLRGRLPSPDNRIVRTAMFLGVFCALTWPLFATCIAVGLVDIQIGIVTEMMIWSVGTAWFATWLAYAVSGQFPPFPAESPGRTFSAPK